MEMLTMQHTQNIWSVLQKIKPFLNTWSVEGENI